MSLPRQGGLLLEDRHRALLRNDIDIFFCPNGHIDAKFDLEAMRFVDDDRGAEWNLEGRVVLCFID